MVYYTTLSKDYVTLNDGFSLVDFILIEHDKGFQIKTVTYLFLNELFHKGLFGFKYLIDQLFRLIRVSL